MRSIIYVYILIIVTILSSCTKNYDSINIDPNRPKSVTPGVMLGQLQYRIVSSTVRASRNFTHEIIVKIIFRSQEFFNELFSPL